MSQDYANIENKICNKVYNSTGNDFCTDIGDCAVKGIVACDNDEKCKGFQWDGENKTKISFCDSIEPFNLSDKEGSAIFTKPIPIRNTEETTINNQSQPTNNSSNNSSINEQLDRISGKYQDLLNRYVTYLKETDANIDKISSDTEEQLAFQDKIINKTTNQLTNDKTNVETTIQKIKARIEQIANYKKKINIMKWVIYILCGVSICVLIFYIYKRLIPTKKIHSIATNIQNSINKGIKNIEKRVELDNLTTNLLKNKGVNRAVVAPVPYGGTVECPVPNK